MTEGFSGEGIDILSERVLCAGLIKYGFSAWTEVCDILTPACFIADTHSVLYNSIDYLFRGKGAVGIDYVSVLSASRAIGYGDFLEAKTEKEYLKELKTIEVERLVVVLMRI